jgi:hypothetical protein
VLERDATLPRCVSAAVRAPRELRRESGGGGGNDCATPACTAEFGCACSDVTMAAALEVLDAADDWLPRSPAPLLWQALASRTAPQTASDADVGPHRVPLTNAHLMAFTRRVIRHPQQGRDSRPCHTKKRDFRPRAHDAAPSKLRQMLGEVVSIQCPPSARRARHFG